MVACHRHGVGGHERAHQARRSHCRGGQAGAAERAGRELRGGELSRGLDTAAVRVAVLGPVPAQPLHVRVVRHQARGQPHHSRRAGHERHHVRRHGCCRRCPRGEDPARGNRGWCRTHCRRCHAVHFAID